MNSPSPVKVGLIAINDFHGALEPPGRTVSVELDNGTVAEVPAGGAAWLATTIDELRARHPYNLTVAAGDLTSASQLASSLFLDEAAIGVMNRIGLDLTAVGNHEFDRGWQELRRLQNGGCEKLANREPCAVEPDFAGASYEYLAANVRMADGSTVFPGTALRTFGEAPNAVTIGFVGLTLKGTAELVVPGGVAGLTFEDEAETINRATTALDEAGADAIVVLIHQGILTDPKSQPNGCADAAGPLLPILPKLDSRVDVIISGHTHWQYICDWPSGDGSKEFLLTSAGFHGILATDINLSIDPQSGDVLSKSAENIAVRSPAFGDTPIEASLPPVAPRADVKEYVARYVDAAQAFEDRPAGHLSQTLEESDDYERGGALGRLIADAQLAATRENGAQIAFMNPGGVRAPLRPSPDGALTFGQIFRTQPFGNVLVTMTLTGAQIRQVLEEQLADDRDEVQILSPSAGFDFTFDRSRAEGQRIVSLSLMGAPLQPDQTYRVTVSNFLAEGGDGFSGFKLGTDRQIGLSDLEALEAWLKVTPPREAPIQERATEIVGSAHL
nr:bifunctional metallophosphatase/5'-nucleotidase [Altericroceibacterium endophyticum]